MRAADFAAGYEKQPSDAFIHQGSPEFVQAMHESREWSRFLGRVTHGLFTSEFTELQDMTSEKWGEYRDWLRGDGARGAMATLESLESEDRARGANELNFHCLNSDMIGMWVPLLYKDSWPDDQFRRDWIKSAQEGLARTGLYSYLTRERYIEGRGGTEVVYETNDVIYKAQTGIMQEFDAGIVLLDVMRRNPDITVVPAPLQFERSRRKSRNVDFLAVHREAKTAIGVQVKSRHTNEQAQAADHERVVFLDGDIDLGNIRAVRVKKGSSKQRVVPWPGIIAAKYVDRIKTHGKGKNLRAARNPARTLHEKTIARRLVNDVSVDFSELSELIGERIMAKLT